MRRSPSMYRYVAAVSVLGLAVLIGAAFHRSIRIPRDGKEWLTLALFTFFMVLGELRPI